MTHHNAATVAEARRLHAEGYGYHKAARLLGVSKWTVREWVRRAAPGYTPPPARAAGRPHGCKDLYPETRRSMAL